MADHQQQAPPDITGTVAAHTGGNQQQQQSGTSGGEADFLAPDNHCGQTLLRLVARGNAILAELLRLTSSHIPHVFLPFDDPSPEVQRYLSKDFPLASRSEAARFRPVVSDFTYLRPGNADVFDSRIAQDADLLDLDEEFRETFMPIVDRFYLLLESVYVYARDYVQFLQDLEGGAKFMQATFESVLVNVDGRQLLTEALHLFGCMLLLCDQRLPGPVRERILVSFYRYRGTEPERSKHIIPVCDLFRSTGFVPHSPPPGWRNSPEARKGKESSSSSSSGSGLFGWGRRRNKAAQQEDSKAREVSYPAEYFARFAMPQQAISMIIGRLRSDDIYQQATFYPLPEHRSTALASQASMLYTILYFRPNILIKKQAIMREIVDKHWPDNWVISYYMGFTVDLSSAWYGFKAARLAIGNTVQPESIRELAQMHMESLHELTKQLQDFLTEGVLTEEYVLDHINKLLNCLRACNVSIRWLMLHRTAEDPRVREIIEKETNAEEVLLLLLNTSQLEFVLKEMFRDLLSKKQEKWTSCKSLTRDRMSELSDYFSGEKALQKVRDEQLQEWFKQMATLVDGLNYDDSAVAGRKINQIMTALEDVKGFHQIESSLQVKQFLNDSIELLRKMIRYVNIKESVLVAISTVSDISYGWTIIRDYVGAMQRWIRRDPSLIIKIRSTFLKLASMLELPLVRISQAQSKDIISVSSYYSNELVHFVRQTLDIIPMSMFNILNQIIDLQTNHLRQVPTKFPRDQLRSYAQLEMRHKLAKATFEVSKFTEGILAMKKTLMGVIEVDPKQLLEDGIRKELVRQVATLLDSHLVFNTGRIQDFEERLRTLRDKLQGMLLSFEYIQDYVKIYGLKIWQEEFSRIINYNVEQECNRFLKRKVLDWQSAYQSSVIPIPNFRPVDEQSNNFMGRLVKEILTQTDPRRTTYYDQLSGWFDHSGNEVVGITTFSLIKDSVGVFGMTGIDTLLSYVNVKYVQTFVRHYASDVMSKPTQEFLASVKELLSPASSLPPGLAKQYPAIVSKLSNVWIFFLEIAVKLGRTQLIRKHIASELNFSCKLDANILSSALDVMNRAILNDIEAHDRSPSEYPYPSRQNMLLPELAAYLETAGIANPLEKVYVTARHPQDLGMLMALFVVAHLPRFQYDPVIDGIVCKNREDWLDAVPLVVGLVSLLRHFHVTETDSFIAFLGQYVRAMIDGTQDPGAPGSGRNKVAPEIPQEVTLVLRFLHIFSKYAGISHDVIERHVHPFLFTKFLDVAPAKSKRR